MPEPLKIDIWSDIACPWCYVGRSRFDEGVRRYAASGGARTVEVEFHAFELSPDTPVDFEGGEVDFLAGHKGIPVDRARQMLEQMSQVAAAEGLPYDYEAIRHTKTLKAHEVLHLAKAHGVQRELKDRLLAAYFAEGRHVGHDEELADLAAEVGIDRDTVLAALREGTYREDVQADIDQARAYDINGVPFFVIDGRYGVSGAQDPEVFAQALARASEEVVTRA